MRDVEARAGEQRLKIRSGRHRIERRDLQRAVIAEREEGAPDHARQRARRDHDARAAGAQQCLAFGIALGRRETQQRDLVPCRQCTEVLERAHLIATHEPARKAVGDEQDAHAAAILTAACIDVDAHDARLPPQDRGVLRLHLGDDPLDRRGVAQTEVAAARGDRCGTQRGAGVGGGIRGIDREHPHAERARVGGRLVDRHGLGAVHLVVGGEDDRARALLVRMIEAEGAGREPVAHERGARCVEGADPELGDRLVVVEALPHPVKVLAHERVVVGEREDLHG